MVLALNKRYRPLSFNPSPDDDQDFRENPETADFTGGESTGPARELQAPAPVQPDIQSKRAMDDGAGKVPANVPPPMSGGPVPGMVGVTPEMLKQPGTASQGDVPDDGAAAPPPAMVGGPQRKASAGEIAEDALRQSVAMKRPEKPKNNTLQTIGQTILGASKFGPAGAEALMHPKYTGQVRAFNQGKADLAEQVKLADDVEKVGLSAAARKSQDSYRASLESDRAAVRGDKEQANLDKIRTAQQKAQEESLKVIKEGGRIARAGDPVAPGMQRISDPADYDIRKGAYLGQTFLDVPQHYGTVELTPEQAEASGGFYKAGQPVTIAERQALAAINAGKYDKKDPAAQENLNHWIAVRNNPQSTPEDVARANKNITDLRKEQTSTHFSFDLAGLAAKNQQASAPIKRGTPEFLVAQQLANGDLTFSQFLQLAGRYAQDSPKRLAIFQSAHEQNPSFNPADFEAGYTFFKSPKVRAQMASLNNVDSGVNDLLKVSDLAERSGATVLNKFFMPKGVAVGGKHYTDFHTARIAFADELAGALGYGGATDMSKEMGLNMADENLSPENFKSAIQDIIVPFLARKRASLLGQMGPYGQQREQQQEQQTPPPAAVATPPPAAVATPPPARGGSGRVGMAPPPATSDDIANAYLKKHGH